VSVVPSPGLTAPPTDFRIEIRSEGERERVAPHGELDIATTPHLDDVLDRLVARGFAAIVIDLRPTTFIDSTAVHLLARQATRPDAMISVIAGPPCVMRVLDIAGVRELVPFEA
jgi:anti-anti-sigma factor